MKKTQLIDALRNIKKRWPSFLSIVLIIMMGTGGFLSNRSIVSSYTVKGTDYYDKTNFKEYDLISNVGIVDDDLEKIKNIEGVKDSEGVIEFPVTILANNQELNGLIISKTERISTPDLYEGRLPEAIDECAINRDIALETNLKIGDRISLTSVKDYEKDPLKKKYFRIVGIVAHPESIRYSNNWLITVDKKAINLEAFNNSYTNAFVDLDKKDFTNQFDDTYIKETKDVDDRLWKELESLGDASKERIVKQSEEEIQKQLEELYKAINEASEEIDDNEDLVNNELAAARKQLADARTQLNDAYKQIEEGKQEIANGESQLNEAKAIYNQLDKLYKSINKENAIKYINEFIDLVDQYQKAIINDDNQQIKNIKDKIDAFLNNEYSSLAIKLIEVYTDINVKEIVDKINAGDGLDLVKEFARQTIDKIEEDSQFFETLTVDKLLDYIAQANKLISELNDAIENKIPEDIEKARDGLIDFLSQYEVDLAFKLIKTYTGVDVDKLIDDIKNSTIIEDNIDILISYVELIRNNEEFLKLFTEEGLREFVDKAFDLVDEYKDAIKSGIKENIEAAREKINEFFSDKGSVIVSKLLERFTGKSLDDFEEYIIDGEVLEEFLFMFDNYMDQLLNDEEFLNTFTKEGVTNIVNELIDYADVYKEAMLDDNQEAIDAARDQYYNFLEQENVQKVLELVEKITGYDLTIAIEAIGNIDRLIKIIDTAQMAKDWFADNSSFLDYLDKDTIVEKLTEFKNLVYLYGNIIKGVAPGNIEEVKAMLDALINEETFKALIELIEETTGIPFRSIIDTITNDFFIDMGLFLLRMQINSLIDNIDFKEEYSLENIIAYLDEVNHYLNIIKNGINKGKAATVDKAINELKKFLAKDHIDFFIDLAEYYFGISLDVIVDFTHDNNKLPLLLDYLSQANTALLTYKSLPGQIAEGEAKLNEGRRQLQSAINDYINAKNLLAQKERELLNGEYQAKQEISDARRLLSEKEDEALKQIEDARKEIENKNYNWLIQGREANQSFIEYKASIKSTYDASVAYGSLFLIVVAMVCFSTISMIVEEEKKSVGTTKAFGFFNREIFNKYLFFSVSAGILGAIAGIIYSMILTNVVLANSNENILYILGDIIQVPDYKMFGLVSIAMIAVCVISCLIACSDLLKSPAALLMKGDTISSRDRKLKNKTKKTSEAGTLYSRLILRNMINEKERVLMSIVIVAASVFTVGIGFAINKGFSGMFERQGTEIYKYDFKVEYGSDIEDNIKQDIKDVLDKYGADYYDLNMSATYFEKDHVVSGLNIITVEDEGIQDFIAIKDPKTKKALNIPSDGILIQSRLNESYGINIGEDLHIYNNDLAINNAKVVGDFLNYNGRLIVFGKDYYQKVFDKEVKNNTYLVNLNGADKDALKEEISNISKQFKVEDADHYKLKLKPILSLYDIVVVVLCGIAVIMSFMILTNLSNIYITRKKNELIVMRINGFSIKETINYLAKETILITIIGMLIAFLMGRFGAVIIIKQLEQKDAQFVRDFDLKVWLLAIAINIVFSIIINSLVFRKVKKLNFREING